MLAPDHYKASEKVMPLSAGDRVFTSLVTTFLPPSVACFKGIAFAIYLHCGKPNIGCLLAVGVISWRQKIN